MLTSQKDGPILKVTDLRSGDLVVDSRNFMVWRVRGVHENHVTLWDIDPVVKLENGSPVAFSTTWRIHKKSEVRFKYVVDR